MTRKSAGLEMLSTQARQVSGIGSCYKSLLAPVLQYLGKLTAMAAVADSGRSKCAVVSGDGSMRVNCMLSLNVSQL